MVVVKSPLDFGVLPKQDPILQGSIYDTALNQQLAATEKQSLLIHGTTGGKKRKLRGGEVALIPTAVPYPLPIGALSPADISNKDQVIQMQTSSDAAFDDLWKKGGSLKRRVKRMRTRRMRMRTRTKMNRKNKKPQSRKLRNR